MTNTNGTNNKGNAMKTNWELIINELKELPTLIFIMMCAGILVLFFGYALFLVQANFGWVAAVISLLCFTISIKIGCGFIRNKILQNAGFKV